MDFRSVFKASVFYELDAKIIILTEQTISGTF